jgi:multidrug efflux pump subunit AcrA (membrane-fusion protein)
MSERAGVEPQDTPPRSIASDAPPSFEQRALGEEINPLEEINAAFRQTNSRVWFGVAGMALLVTALVVWGIVAQQIVTTSTQVTLLPASGLYQVPAPQRGVVERIDVAAGSPVVPGERLGAIDTPGGQTTAITSPVAGTVATVHMAVGEVAQPGSAFVGIAPAGSETVAIGLLNAGTVAAVARGQHATVAIPIADQVRYGRIEGTVAFVASLPISAERMAALFGTSVAAATTFQSMPLYEVRIDLLDAPTPSGFKWTVGTGPATRLPVNTVGTASIIVAHRSLASRAFGS